MHLGVLTEAALPHMTREAPQVGRFGETPQVLVKQPRVVGAEVEARAVEGVGHCGHVGQHVHEVGGGWRWRGLWVGFAFFAGLGVLGGQGGVIDDDDIGDFVGEFLLSLFESIGGVRISVLGCKLEDVVIEAVGFDLLFVFFEADVLHDPQSTSR
jgi:hypothetical protein